MSDGIDNVRNFGLVCYTWVVSHSLQKVANEFPESARTILRFAKRLQAASSGILFLSSTLTSSSLTGEDGKNIQLLLDVQLSLHQCHRLLGLFSAFNEVLRLSNKGSESTPYLKIRGENCIAFSKDALEYIEETLLYLEEIISHSSKALLGTISHFELSHVLSWQTFNKRYPEMTGYLSITAGGITRYSASMEIKVLALSPGLIIVAVQPSLRLAKKTNENLDSPDVRTLTCLIFKSQKRQHEMELVLDDYQPAHIQQKGNLYVLKTVKIRAVPYLDEKIMLKGKFVIQIDYGRPKTRALILTGDHIYMTREKADSTLVKVPLCLRKEVILVAFNDASKSKILNLVGSITFFWKKGSGKTSTIAAAKVDFSNFAHLVLWAAFITSSSKCNQILNSSGYMNDKWPSENETDGETDDVWSVQAMT